MHYLVELEVAPFCTRDLVPFYYLYGVIDDVIKASIAVMGWEKDLVDIDESPTEHRPGDVTDTEAQNLERVAVGYFYDEQAMWQRKLTEHLVDLIGFSKANDQETYRCYLAASQLVDLLGVTRPERFLRLR